MKFIPSGAIVSFWLLFTIKNNSFSTKHNVQNGKNKIIKSQTKVLLPLVASINALKGVTTTKRYIQHIKGSQTFQRKNSLVLMDSILISNSLYFQAWNAPLLFFVYIYIYIYIGKGLSNNGFYLTMKIRIVIIFICGSV